MKGPGYRNRPRRDYTVLRNAALRDTKLSLKAKGCLALMLTFPDDWAYHLGHLETLSRDGRDALRAAIRELENAGYIERHQTRGPGGRLAEAEYRVSDDVRVAVDGKAVDGNAVHGPSEQASTVDGFSVAGKTVAGETVAGKPATTKTEGTKTEDTKTEKTATRKRAGSRSRFEPEKVELPPHIDRIAWQKFCRHLAERGRRPTQTMVEELLENLAEHPQHATGMLLTSVKHGWTSVYPPDPPKAGSRGTSDSAAAAADWQALLALAQRGISDVSSLSPPSQAAVRAIGGWRAVAHAEGAYALRKLEADFLAAHRDFIQRQALEEAAA